MKLNTVWYCYTLLCIVIFHTVVASPYAARRIARSVEVVDAGSSAVDQPATLDDDVFGENSHHGGEKDKRLINPLKKIKPLKIGAGALKAGALGVGLKAASKIGKVGVKAAATLGIKALIINLLFGQINKIIDFKTRLLTQLDQQNRLKNAQYLGIGLPEHKPIPATNPVNQGSRGSNAGSAGRDNDSGDNSTTTELPPFDREKVALQIPNTFVGPAFNVVNGASQIIGNVLQNFAGRIARLIEALKPLFRLKLGIRSRKRETDADGEETDQESGDLGSDASAASEEVVKFSNTPTSPEAGDQPEKSNVKTSYTALSSS
ncbi:uncharacterized protein [Bemisia tabaci]|uniref:uncharacterized protein isoform X2 n=1 Tax=Bemisia tabaci TaxID=7038 RepID=UPI003B27DC24